MAAMNTIRWRRRLRGMLRRSNRRHRGPRKAPKAGPIPLPNRCLGRITSGRRSPPPQAETPPLTWWGSAPLAQNGCTPQPPRPLFNASFSKEAPIKGSCLELARYAKTKSRYLEAASFLLRLQNQSLTFLILAAHPWAARKRHEISAFLTFKINQPRLLSL